MADEAAASALEKQVMVMGIDESEHSRYALQWTLRRFFSSGGATQLFRLVLVHAKRSAASVVGIIGPGSINVLPVVEADLRKTAGAVIEKAREICAANQVNDVTYEVVEGDPRNVLCETVEKYHADMLVLGNHGHGAIKRAVLGSVSDYCAHHAHCTVMIVKKPKAKGKH